MPSGNTDKLRMAIVGCGGIGRNHHMHYFAEDDRVEFVVACDLVERRAAKVAAQYGVPHVETDYREALTKYELDAVTVCTSNDAHAPVSIFAAEHGLHVLCEKPLALNLAEAEAMLAAVTKAGVVHMIDFSKRFPAHSRFVKQLLESGQYGRVYAAHADYFQGYRADPACPVAWRVQKHRAGSGVLGDLGSHAIDLLRFWLGEPTSVSGYTANFIGTRPAENGEGTACSDCDDLAFAMGELPGRIPYSLRTTWNRAGTGDELRVEILCERATIFWRMHSPATVSVVRGGGWEGGVPEVLAVPDELDVNPFRRFVDHCIAGTQVPEPTFEDGMRVQRIVDAVLGSTGGLQTLA